MPLRLALYQPDMPPNTGAMMRLCACFGIGMDLIEPCGFVADDARIKRVAMDYIQQLQMARHRSWQAFLDQLGPKRLILLTVNGAVPYTQHAYNEDDVLLVGRESAGVPPEVHDRADARVVIPLRPPARSLNVAMAAGIVLAEALRQTGRERGT
ncbi:MAG: tRNA methyltransferase [Alphaproteobacteria bacterium]|nr:tRNA methyltransferase [Alphaproteobacteria bacterium]